MQRTETYCPRCRQVNVRHEGRWAWLVNPRSATHCTLCGTHLQTGLRDGLDLAHGIVMWVALYLGHVVVGAGGMAVVSVLLWPEIMSRPVVVRVAPLILGVLAGGMLAERSRRRGRLLGHSRVEKGGRRVD
jgi:hypothetical protein